MDNTWISLYLTLCKHYIILEYRKNIHLGLQDISQKYERIKYMRKNKDHIGGRSLCLLYQQHSGMQMFYRSNDISENRNKL